MDLEVPRNPRITMLPSNCKRARSISIAETPPVVDAEGVEPDLCFLAVAPDVDMWRLCWGAFVGVNQEPERSLLVDCRHLGGVYATDWRCTDYRIPGESCLDRPEIASWAPLPRVADVRGAFEAQGTSTGMDSAAATARALRANSWRRVSVHSSQR